MTCAVCGGRTHETNELHKWTYGNELHGDIEVSLSAMVPVKNCERCEESFIDHRAEKIKDRAVKKYLDDYRMKAIQT